MQPVLRKSAPMTTFLSPSTPRKPSTRQTAWPARSWPSPISRRSLPRAPRPSRRCRWLSVPIGPRRRPCRLVRFSRRGPSGIRHSAERRSPSRPGTQLLFVLQRRPRRSSPPRPCSLVRAAEPVRHGASQSSSAPPSQFGTAPPARVASARPSSPLQAAGASEALSHSVVARLETLGLTSDQVEAVLKLSAEVVERVVWEVVPDLAEAMIREELHRLIGD